MLSICEIWNKLALRSDPNPGCLCHKKKKKKLKVMSGADSSLLSLSFFPNEQRTQGELGCLESQFCFKLKAKSGLIRSLVK